MSEKISKQKAIEFLNISDKDFKNYHESSKEIEGEKIGGWPVPQNLHTILV